MFAPNVDCSGVCLYRLLRTTFAISPRFSSIQIRMPCLSDWSAMLRMPFSTLSFTRSAILRMTPSSPPFLTWNGSSVMTIASWPPFCGSMWATARMRMRPRPVS